MDNQQAKVSDNEIGWLAGFLDGEGSFMLMQRPDRRVKTPHKVYDRRKLWAPRICVANTHIPTLNHVTNLLDRLGLPYHISWRQFTTREYKTAWDLRVQGLKRCYRWLIQIAPYLVTKKRQAELMLDWINSRKERNMHDDYSAAEAKIIAEFRVINH